MDNNDFHRNMFGIVYNSDGSIKKACGVIPMVGILIAIGSVVVQTVNFF